MNRTKSILTILLTALLCFGFFFSSLLLSDKENSFTERRPLASMPVVSLEDVLTGEYMTDLETYLLDQFPLRDDFRTLKALLSFEVFQKKDNNEVYLVGDQVLKIEYPLEENQINYGADKIQSVIDTYLEESNIFYSIIPDKNYFVAEENGYPHLDYDRLIALMKEGITGATYIDLFDDLTIDDYYRTDIHWKQENIFKIAETLSKEMGFSSTLIPEEGFTTTTLEGFYGAYWGQSALSVVPDSLTYVTSDAIDASIVTSAEFEGEKEMYDLEGFYGMDGYDLYLHGPEAILTIESPLATTDKELIIFRDSFGSSLAPYFAEGYSKVTLIDLRYVSSTILSDYVTFNGQDVLFLYSTSILNSAMLLK